jgi:hypothetical protein
MADRNSRFLFVSDCQIPFEAPDALAFCKRVQREYKIPDEHVYNVGDETDLYHGSMHKKDPDAELTPNQEIMITRRKLKEWYKAFPKMKLAVSNHGLRWLRKAIDAEIPSQVVRCYRDLIHAPSGWVWKDRWLIDAGRTKIMMQHGMGYSGRNGHINAAIDNGINTIIGHLHSHAAINYLGTEIRQIWAMNVGSLIHAESFAFKYGRYNRNKPVLSVGVVVDGGKMPILVPYEGRL